MAKKKAEATGDEWKPGTMYIRHLAGGKGHIEIHQCWNTDVFIANQTRICEELNGKLKPGEKRISFEVANHAEYIAERRNSA